MASKYYAVRQGRHRGIYNSWEDCKVQVNGYKGAIYKGFTKIDDAIQFIATEKFIDTDLVAYTDGSFSSINNKTSWAVIFIPTDTQEEVTLSGNLVNNGLQNIQGELKAAKEAIRYAYTNNKSITIYHDYLGVYCWTEGYWEIKNDYVQKFVDYVQKVKKKIVVQFVHVFGHTGNYYNEKVDALAKEALLKE